MSDPLPKLQVETLTKSFDGTVAVDDFDLSLGETEVVALLGPSGCGKTTTLRCVAGLERLDGGRIFINGDLVDGAGRFVPPERRNIGMVFQSYALWPHMTVFDNIAYGLRLRRRDQASIARKVGDLADLMGIAGLTGRYPYQLSGGQQQRVALARSLVIEPQLILFDEPLSNLDAKLRLRMRVELRAILDRIGIAAIYVTHDQSEALTIADRIVVMNAGRIVQAGLPEDIYERPTDRFVADFVGSSNLVAGRVVESVDGGYLAQAEGAAIRVHTRRSAEVGESVLLSVAAENVGVGLTPAAGPNSWPARIRRRVYLGQHYDLFLDVAGLDLRASVSRAVARQLTSDAVHVSIEPGSLIEVIDHA